MVLTVQDRGRADHELFLLAAADAMRVYWDRQGEYATRWHQLAITFAVGLYHIGDPDVRPPAADRERWRPRGSDWTYIINSANAMGFRVEAGDSFGRPGYAIGPPGEIAWLGGGDAPTALMSPRAGRDTNDSVALALHLVWEASHGLYRNKHPGTVGDSVAAEVRANINQLDFYEEMRDQGHRDPELERRRAARAAGLLEEDIRGRYPDLPEC